MTTFSEKIHFKKNAILVLFSLISSAALAEEKPQEMIDFVKEAKTYAETVGKEQALEEFSKQDGKFNRGELYIYAYDFDGNIVAHGEKPDLVGRNVIGLVGTKGSADLEEIRELILRAEGGSGTLESQKQNTTTEEKITRLNYVEKIDETYFIGSHIDK